MEPNSTHFLTPEELRRLDGQYTPFPAFGEWASSRDVFDSDLWNTLADQLVAARTTADSAVLDTARELVMRAAAFDTGAIEGLYTTNRGFTMTVAEQTAAWAQELTAKGPLVRALFEAQLHAYELVLDVAHHAMPMTEAWVRRLHEVLCEPQETYTVHTQRGAEERPLPKGEYKSNPNHVRTSEGHLHAYAPVNVVASEMHRLVEEVGTPDFVISHAGLQASYVHYALAAIHAFADGNGRVARAVASTFVSRSLSIPLLIFVDQQSEYLDALEQADAGRYEPFIEFTYNRGIEGAQLVLDTLRTASSVSAAEGVERLRRILTARENLSHRELDEIAHSIVQGIYGVTIAITSELGLPKGVSLHAQTEHAGTSNLQTGYRRNVARQQSAAVGVHLSTTAPAAANVSIKAEVQIAIDATSPYAFVVYEHLNGDACDVRLEEVHPVTGAALEKRIETWVQRWLGQALATLADQAQASLGGSGYQA